LAAAFRNQWTEPANGGQSFKLWLRCQPIAAALWSTIVRVATAFFAPSKDAMSNVITLPNYFDQIQQEDLRIRYAASAGLSKHLLHVRIHPMSIFVPFQLLSYNR
jgi:hypothetical protein